MKNLEKLLKLYDYNLPVELIAKKPANPRDNSRLLVYNRKSGDIKGHTICFDKFYNLDKYLPKNAVLVFNETKVLPARLELKKESGGKAKFLYLGQKNNLIEFLSDRKLNIGSKLFLKEKEIFQVAGKKENKYFLKLQKSSSLILNDRLKSAKMKNTIIFDILKKYGTMPIPPYIKNSPLSEKQLRIKYQTIFARIPGSVAAPTASLHFTKRVFSNLKKKDIDIKFVNLNVGLGTFATLTKENLKNQKLHKEFYNIDKKTAEFLNRAKKQKRPIIAVGTTVIRTLESAVANNSLKKLSGETQLFIQKNYNFKFVDGLITNFHIPKSSLLMLVSALTGRKQLLEIYQKAIDQKFKFYSFGDGMLIL